MPDHEGYDTITQKAQEATYSGKWADNDFLGLGYSAKLTLHFGYAHVSSGISSGGWAIGNEDSQYALRVFVEVIIKTKGYRGFNWITGGRPVLRERSAIDYQDNVQESRVVAVWSGTLFPNTWVALWYNDDANSGSTEQPIGAPLEWYVREQVGDEDLSQIVPSNPPYRHRTTRDAYDSEDIVKYDDTPVVMPVENSPEPTPAYVGPNPSSYKVYTSLGDQFYYSLYHQLLNRYPSKMGSVWVLNRNPRGNGGTLYQQTPNGDGWLDLSRSEPSWDAGAWHLVYFTQVSGRWAIGDGNGRYLCWANTPSVGSYVGSSASFQLGFTTAISSALSFEFVYTQTY